MTERLHLNPLNPEIFDQVPVEVFNALVDVVNTLADGAALYEAHVENLIERAARVEQHLWPEEWTADDESREFLGWDVSPGDRHAEEIARWRAEGERDG